MLNPEQLERSNFDVTFESKGVQFIFTDIALAHYMPPLDCVTVGHTDTTRDFMAHRTLEVMGEEGSLRSVDQTKETITRLEKTIESAVAQTAALSAAPSIELRDIEHTLSIAADVCRGYVYFEPPYWESVVSRIAVDESAKENVELVEGNKNVFRTHLEKVFFSPTSMLHVLLAKLGAQCNVSKEDLLWYREQELVQLFEGKRVPQEEITARKQAHFYYKSAEGLFFASGDKAATLGKKFDDRSEVTEILKGKVAHKKDGVVQGKVRKIERDFTNDAQMRAQMQAMEEGEVLVCVTTDPELMEACRKAAAIVTDVGGMLSHTAIVSRELNIPCIVATQNASKVLRNGDLVEVDTQMGEVRILRRAA